MIEALIDIATGDVIVAKPVGSIWGSMEVNRVVLLDDPALEAECSGLQHVVYPYAAHGVSGRKRKMLQRSLVKVKVDAQEIQDTASTKFGILRASQADTPVAVAKIEAVRPDPKPSKNETLVKPTRPLPTVSK